MDAAPQVEPEQENATPSPAVAPESAGPLFRLYFLRHAPAADARTFEGPDDERPLTKEGRKGLREARRGLRQIIGTPDAILASPYARTQETAKLLAETLRFAGKVELNDHLVHGGRPDMLATMLGSRVGQRDIVLVGHSPDLERWIAQVTLGREESGWLELKKGGVARVDVSRMDPEPRGTLRWVLPPSLLRALD